MKIQVIGPGCPNARPSRNSPNRPSKNSASTAEINKVTDLKQIMALGVMMTPALAVNGTIKVVRQGAEPGGNESPPPERLNEHEQGTMP